MKFYNYLNEKLIKINKQDIDKIYNPLDEFVKLLNKLIEIRESGNTSDSIKREIINFADLNEVISSFTSDELSSKKAKMAHAIKPIKIVVIPRLEGPNHYQPTKNKIVVGISDDIIKKVLLEYKLLSEKDKERIKHEFDPERIKSTIRHEITHWVDDAIHGEHITNLMKRVIELSKSDDSESVRKVFSQGYDIVNLTDREINAIVNQLDQVRKELGKRIWNMLTWEDLETRLSTIYSKRLSSDVSYELRKKLKKRMAREGILGKNMR